MLEVSSSDRGSDPDVDSSNLAYIEQMYAQYLRDPTSVSADWRRYFRRLSGNGNGNGVTTVPQFGPSFRPASVFNPPARDARGGADVRELEMALLQDRLDQLIRAYRVRGHLVANIDPLGMPRPHLPELDPEYYGFTEQDMERPFSTATIRGPDVLTLRDVITRLRNTYCRSIGVQYMHMDDLVIRQWLQDRMEGTENRIKLSKQEQLRILTRLTDATIFEQFIQKRFTGAKSFSLEGAESLIPLLDLTIEKAGDQGIHEIVLGMAHRGRLNVLANIMGKSPQGNLPRVCRPRSQAAPGARRREVSLGLQQRLAHRGAAIAYTSRCASIPVTWSLSVPWPWAASAPSKTAPATPSASTPCRC